MNVRNCRNCGRLFNYIAGAPVCPACKDELEKKDLVQQCKEIIDDMSSILQQSKVVTEDEQKALNVYRQAEKYFRKTCKQ